MARRSKGDGSLFQRANGMWIGVVELPTQDGRRRQKRVSSMDRNKCIDKLKKLRRDVEDGYLPVTASTTVEKWLDRWMNEIHHTQIRPTTRISYETTIRLYINPSIGSKRLDKLTPEHVRQMQRFAAETSDQAAWKAHVVLQAALKDAVREGLLRRTVTDAVHKPRFLATPRTALTTEQAKHLLRCSINNGDRMATRWAAALLVGGRQGEMIGLTWDRVDLDHGLIDLSWQLQQMPKQHGCGPKTGEGWPCGKQRAHTCPKGGWHQLPADFEYRHLVGSVVLTRPKTRAGWRVVPLPEPLWLLLMDPVLREGPNPHNLVWHHQDGRPLRPREDYRNWQDALKAADLPAAPLHVARHTTATLLAEAGVPEQVRMEILGQSAVAAHRGYVHMDVAHRREALAALNDLLELEG